MTVGEASASGTVSVEDTDTDEIDAIDEGGDETETGDTESVDETETEESADERESIDETETGEIESADETRTGEMETDDTIPGFGLAVGMFVVVLTAVLAARRNQ